MGDRRGTTPKAGVTKKIVTRGAIPKQRSAPFLPRSGKTVRSPPNAPKPTSEANESVYLCEICRVADSIEKIQCDKCMLWYHFTCGKLSKDVLKLDTFACDNCQQQPPVQKEPLIDITTENPFGDSGAPHTDPMLTKTISVIESSVNPRMEKAPSVGKKSNTSRKTSSVTSTVSRRAALALQKLEEERQILEMRENEAAQRQRERDKEYLNQKYSILEDDVMSNLSFDDQEIEQQKFESIQQWAKDIPVHTSNNVLDNDEVHVDNGPRLNSTTVKQQSTLEQVKSTSAVRVGDVTSSIETRHIDSLARTSLDGVPVHLPTWLTHPHSTKPVTNPWSSGQKPVDKVTSPSTLVNIGDVNNEAAQVSTEMKEVAPVCSSTIVTKGTVSTYNQDQVKTVTNPHQPQTTVVSEIGVQSSNDQAVASRNNCSTSSTLVTSIYKQCLQPTEMSQQFNGAVSIQAVSHQSKIDNASVGTTPFIDAKSDNQPTGGIHQLMQFSPQPVPVTSQSQFRQSFGQLQTPVHNLSTNPFQSHSQSVNTSHFIGNGQSNSYSNQLSGIGHSRSQTFSINQTTSQPQFLGANQQSWTSQPQVFGFSQQPQQPHFNTNQSFGVNQSFGDSTTTYNTNQPHSFGNQMVSANTTFQQPLFSNIHQSFASNSSTIQSNMGTNYIPVSQPFNNNSLNTNNGSITSVTTQGTASIRLTAEQIASRHVMPKDLPIFNGDPRQWYAFISAYENGNETCGFSDNENLGRIRRCLKGEAETAVKGRLLHKDSVKGVIATLKLMFGRPELIMETLLADIQKIPAPKDDDLPALIKFAMSVQNLSATIQHCGASEHLRNPMMINSIVDKLPAMHRMNWAFHKQTIGNVNIGHLGDWLYQIADVLSQVVRVSSKPSKKQEPKTDSDKKKADDSKSNPFLNTQVENTSSNSKSNAYQSKDSDKQSCPACNSHKCTTLSNCKKFKDATLAERWNIVKKNKICGRCFGNHKYYRCQSSQGCFVTGCKAPHHKLLHNYESSPQQTTPNEAEKKTCNSHNSKTSQRIDKFRIVPVMLHHKDKTIRDYAYLDDGSNMTTMEDSLANELNLSGTSKELCIDWAFGQTHSAVDSKIVSVKISGYYDNAPRFKMTNVRTVKNLHLPIQSITTSWIDQYQHLKNVPIATYELAKPRLLIGLQYSKLIASLETVEGKDDEPIACKTRLGWVVQGPTYESDKTPYKQRFSMNMCVCQTNDNDLHQLVKNYFSMEHMGIKVPENNLESIELKRAKQILDSTTVKKGDRYETGLLWNHDDVELPDSYNMALKRLICLETKMAKNPELKSKLFTQMKQYVEKGYVRKLSKDEVKNCKHRVWYLPTFPVFNPKKPEKVRLVWDGAAKVKNTSLNSQLLVGPDQLVPLPELLRRFREREVGVIGDITEMFHQIGIQESDQHAQRFLWREDPSLEPDIYVMMVMTFGSKCSPSSAQYVKNKNAKRFEKEFPRAVESIVHNHYVDDMIDSTDDIDEAETLVNDVKMIHRSGGFEIRNFASNSTELLERIGEKVVPHTKNLNIGNESGTERVLGMFWDTTSDSFTYSLKFTKVNEKMLSGEYRPTKREVLRVLMSVFDPLGLIANFLVHGKILLQQIWRSKIEWDEKIDTPIYERWLKWIRVLPSAEKLHIPRWYSPKLSPKNSKSIQLHTFVDAGEEACCATCYLRIEDEEGVDCCLVSAKTKVAPTKEMSVPRLELQAAVMGCRLAANVKSSQRLTIEREVFWSDSQTVMAWINSESRRYNQFVSFRVGEILESTETSQWHWVPSKQNVADEATKSKKTKSIEIPKLVADSRWLKAPAFLYESENKWPNKNQRFTTEKELRPCFAMSIREIQSQQLIDLDRFSQWNRLVHVQAYVLRFVHNLKVQKQQRRIGLLSQDELTRAENQLYQRAQRDAFMDEILVIKHNENIPLEKQKRIEPSSELRTFSPYLDEQNTLRQRGRIDAAPIAYDTKRPIILPRRHRVTKLLVDWYHRRYKHLNHQTAINEIKQKFIIPALRVVMKSVRTSCQKCKNANATPRIPEMSELPQSRLATFTRPFTFTGVDYFGPFPVKINRSVVPRYGVIFTCLTTRAVHIEVADSMDTSSCINAVRRFSARKGKPRKFQSDNGTNFHGADNELKREFEKLNKDEIQQEFTSIEQEWHFNPPTASHMGGAWERLIQTVKKCAKQMLTTKTPTQEMLTTLMAEVENIVNSRPLTYVSLDTADDEALTPNHFLFGTSNALTPIADTCPQDLNRNDWKAIQEMTNHFWRRFVLEYLPDLTKRTKWLQQVEPIKVGDVVLVIDERNARNSWPKGIVEEVIVAKDGRIRQVMVRFGKRTLPRPVSKLAILDVKPPNKEIEVELNTMESLNGGKDVVQPSKTANTDLLEIINRPECQMQNTN